MKANAPEKIYLCPNGLISYCRNTDEDIEYTCTDAFIEKACKFFAPYIQDNSGGYDREIVLKNFENYIKEKKV